MKEPKSANFVLNLDDFRKLNHVSKILTEYGIKSYPKSGQFNSHQMKKIKLISFALIKQTAVLVLQV